MLNLGGRHGGKGAGVAAFDCNTGKLIWHATDHEGSYASQSKQNFKEETQQSSSLVKVLLGPHLGS